MYAKHVQIYDRFPQPCEIFREKILILHSPYEVLQEDKQTVLRKSIFTFFCMTTQVGPNLHSAFLN